MPCETCIFIISIIEIPTDAKAEAFGVERVHRHGEITTVRLVEMVVVEMEPQFLQSEIHVCTEDGVTTDFGTCGFILQDEMSDLLWEII